MLEPRTADEEFPLVSVGIPTFNRPELLRRAAECVLEQTYPNFEVIISNNASTDPQVMQVLEYLERTSDKVRVVHQPTNIGMHPNFFYLFERTRGDYFLLAADDDRIAPWLIERCVATFRNYPNCALVATEIQYVDFSQNKLDFIAQGGAFRSTAPNRRFDRIKRVIGSSNDNMVYGLFRRSALVSEGVASWSKVIGRARNETPALVLAADKGDVVVLPDVGVHKRASDSTYRQVAWEYRGGRHPSGPLVRPRSLINTASYHWAVLQEMKRAISQCSVSLAEKAELAKYARQRISQHFFQMMAGYKQHVEEATCG